MSKRLQRPTQRPQLPLPPLAGPGRLVYPADPVTGELSSTPAGVRSIPGTTGELSSTPAGVRSIPGTTAGVRSIPGTTAAPVRMRWERLPEYLARYSLRVDDVIQCLGAETVLVAEPIQEIL